MRRGLLLFIAAFEFLGIQAQFETHRSKKVHYDFHQEEENTRPGTTAIAYSPKGFLKDVRFFSGTDSVYGKTLGLLLYWTDTFYSKLDSVSIISKNGSRFVMDDLFRDSSVVTNLRGQFFMPEFILDSQKVIFLRENEIREMDLFFEKRQHAPVKIWIKPRSQDAIMKII